MKKTTKSLNTSSTSRCPKQKAKRYGQPIQELIDLYNFTPKQAISMYYGWRANL